MIDMATALQRVMQSTLPLSAEPRDVSSAVQSVLAEPVVALQDAPPFTKSLMDGFAIRSHDMVTGSVEFQVVGHRMAGDNRPLEVKAGEAVQIMTGAPLPQGADAVVVQELASDPDQMPPWSGSSTRVLLRGPIQPDQNVLNRGSLYRTGDVVIPVGRLIRPIELGLLAELGYAQVMVHRTPRVAILPTGDELVDDHGPLPTGSIRNSNGPLLASLCADYQAIPVDLGVTPDQPARLKEQVLRGLNESDLLVISGGMSVGAKDLMPQILRECGVECDFHGVHMKPGKPLWFGRFSRAHADGTIGKCLVFGLPGNPLSVFAGFQLFVRPALLVLRGFPRVPHDGEDAREGKAAEDRPLDDHPLGPTPRMLPLASDHTQRGDRPTWIPCRQTRLGDLEQVALVAWQGSADLLSLSRANGLALISGQGVYPAGTPVKVLTW